MTSNISEILEELSSKQWRLGNRGLIPLSKHTLEAQQQLTQYFKAEMLKLVGEDGIVNAEPVGNHPKEIAHTKSENEHNESQNMLRAELRQAIEKWEG